MLMAGAMLILGLVPLFDFGGGDDLDQPVAADHGRTSQGEADTIHGPCMTALDGADHDQVEAEDELASLSLKAGVIQRGDTLMALLGDFFSPGEIIGLARQCEDIFSLSRITAGQAYAITTQGEDFRGFEYHINASEKLKILKAEEGFQITRALIEFDVSVERVAGTINSHLYEAVAQTGETAELAVRLADIFAWDIDFLRDIRQGDSFAVVVEKRSLDGEPAGYGRILAAEFINQGQAHRGFLFETEAGLGHYYDENGRSLRKAFLKAPLDFARITSGFSRNRLHPILGVSRPHLGTDYAAPTGTPIKSVGEGTITVMARDNASGNYVTVRHANGYETSYLHMSRFASGLKRGLRVRQGQVIGYVGQTGWATGPHVCFRMKRNGQHINPVKLKVPPAEGVPQARMEDFAQVVSSMRAELGSEQYSAEAPHQFENSL